MADPVKILVVDDEPDIVDVLVSHLHAEGFAVLVARDGLEALSIARTQEPDLILLDLMLPKLNGYDVCRLLKFDPTFRHIPIIMVTASSGKESMERGLGAGADEYRLKPLDLETLRLSIQEHLAKSHAYANV